MKPQSGPKRVAVLPTGKTEWHGMAQALAQLFPPHTFYCVPTAPEVASYGAQYPYNGFTSSKLTAAHLESPPESAQELLKRAAQEAVGSSPAQLPPADLVVVLDDGELANAAQLSLVTDVFRAAAVQHLSSLQGSRARTEAAFREKVSFHLVVPMVEAWFFADPAALVRAGVTAGQPVCFASTQDPEQFVTQDAAYLAASMAHCPSLALVPSGRQKKLRPKWLGSLSRQHHPKGYLQWLCLAGQQCSCTAYDETNHGAAALRGLNWTALLQRPSPQLGFLTSLLSDIADGVGQPLPSLLLGRYEAPETSRATPRATPVLRNL